MTKNNAMRLGSVMLVLALLTMCALSGTFAKYTTESEVAESSARVAYWGFNEDATQDFELFKTEYGNGAKGSNNIVAPGTSNSAEFGFAYKKGSFGGAAIEAPEVAYTFAVDVTVGSLEDEAATEADVDALDGNTNFTWTLQASNSNSVQAFQTLDGLVAAIKALSGDTSGSKDYDAGALPPAFGDSDTPVTYTVGWNWAFFTGDDDDAADTTMGNAENLDDLKLQITVSATQRDASSSQVTPVP